ncbi:C4-type zinc ribbon domain-containing protein [Christensenellaceae bacterium OttesenSCG-928-K19]|nr:C4-type zinc ribbon domain-containing protein [Christensenellaceae bacterium OttesenSCG-928-K19]
MDRLKALWEYQAAENELEQLERSLKNTETRKKLIRQQQLFQSNQQHLKQLEQESVLANNKMMEISAQADALKKQMEQKDSEITEIADYDLEDLFLEDVREIIKECESIKSAIEMNKRKLVDIMHKLEKSETDIKETLVKMSNAKKAFDQLKAEHAKELDAGKGDLEKLRANVAKASKAVEKDLMEKYKEIKQHRPNPVAFFKNKRCQGCNMELPSEVLQDLKAGTKIVQCENCGRILYAVEE